MPVTSAVSTNKPMILPFMTRMSGSHAGLCFDTSSGDGGCERGVVAFVLVGIRLGKVG
jgi:hypothetical protein